MSNPFAYLSYPYGLQEMPKWMKAVADSFLCFDPNISVTPQLETLNLGVKEAPIEIIKSFRLPQFVLSAPDSELVGMEGPFISGQVWRDVYFLIRSGVVVVAADLLNLSDEIVTLSLALALGIPIILVSDRLNLPPQLRYVADVVVSSDPGKFLPMIRHYIPEKQNA